MQLHRAHEERGAGGGDVVLIGQGSPRQAAHFRARLAPDLPVLADEERASYRAAGARRAGLTGLVTPGSVAKGVRATRRSGVVQGRPVGDVRQLGGAAVVRPDGTIAFSRMARDAGDNVAPEELLAALTAASPSG